MSFSVRVHPGASATRFKELMSDGTLKIDIAAAPEDGKANVALRKFLSKEFDVPIAHVEILSGETGRKKVVRITQ